MENKVIFKKHTKEENGCLVVSGAGKFNEAKLILTKEEAMLLYIDLHKFIMKSDNTPNLNRKK